MPNDGPLLEVYVSGLTGGASRACSASCPAPQATITVLAYVAVLPLLSLALIRRRDVV